MPRYLYVHVPFCLRKCIYCDFASVPIDHSFAKSYVEALKKEIRLRGKGDVLDGIYIGGGTPTVLPETLLQDLLATIGESFGTNAPAEITVEANPDTVDGERLDLLLESGVNRLSIGVQSLNDIELNVLGRTHSAKRAIDAVADAQSAGFKNISIDLIYGIPGQKLKRWSETLNKAVELGVKHISAYELTVEKGTPLSFAIDKGQLQMPEDDLVADMFFYTIEALSGAGYAHYEISNYAVPGFECRHNLNYWRRGEYTGLGAGAHSFEDGVRFKNTPDIQRYIESVESGLSPAMGHEEADHRETLFLGLRMAEGIRLEDEIGPRVKEFISGGLMELNGDRLRLTRRGLALYNQVVVRLI